MRSSKPSLLESIINFEKPTTGARARNAQQPLRLEALEDRLVLTTYPDFSLPDLHPSTPTSGQNVGPALYRGAVSGYYFTNPG